MALPECGAGLIVNTNRDLYLALEKLAKEQAASRRSLEEFLRAMLRSGEAHANCVSLSLRQFHDLLAGSFASPCVEFNENWRAEYDALAHESHGNPGWRATLIRQIVDLREMSENGTLDDKQRYFGVDSPRHTRWYNFDPVSFIECAMAGSLGGWEPGDDTGRSFVPGPVAVVLDDGSMGSARPESLPRPQFELPQISWELFQEFLWCGQNYE